MNTSANNPDTYLDSAWLSARWPGGELARLHLTGNELIIGREAPAGLIIPAASISRRHACLQRIQGSHYICDLASRNGTFVNGQPVGSALVPLQDGDEIVLGGVAELHFHNPGETVEAPRIGKLHGVWIDPLTRSAWVDARPVDPPLSAAQFTLLARLYAAAGQVVTRAEIIATVWPDVNPEGVSEEAVDGLIKRLRSRLRETQPEREYLEVLRGHGLRLLS